VVALAAPFGAIPGILEAGRSWAGKILIDCTNPVGSPLPSDVGSAAEIVAKLANGARVVKSFNTQGAESIFDPKYGDEAASNFYCGDDDEAKKVVRGLIADVGFDPIDAGPLRNARLLESAAMLWMAVSRTLGTRHVAFRLLRR
jgi:predicted dinucleotide-binding enzyme